MSAHGHVDMGHTVAGWTGTFIAVVGFTIAGIGVTAVSALVIAAGTATVVLAAGVTWVLHLAGWGKPSGPRPDDQWDWRVRDVGARGGHPDCLGCRMAGRRPDAVGGEGPRQPVAETAGAAFALPADARSR
ncbi:HGxxPAAW family protein [Streptomyces sp. NBC_01334]|uniref:HGxxPAAW family protein n=1 Tax=Streptomyces sp. NBC_01334 TaxID=2903827 RepID=UPI002E13B358|nr:HGxxPAAW family protein [Streptomyces sp. NBC_01334]